MFGCGDNVICSRIHLIADLLKHETRLQEHRGFAVAGFTTCTIGFYRRYDNSGKMALDVEEAKRNIVEALGDKSSRYWELLKNWYRKKVVLKLRVNILINTHQCKIIVIAIKITKGLFV